MPGVGAKTARPLQSTDTRWYTKYYEITGGADKLVAGKDSAYVVKIARIWTDAPVKFDPKTTDVNQLDREKAEMEKLEFRVCELARYAGRAAPEHKPNTAKVQPLDDTGKASVIMAETIAVAIDDNSSPSAMDSS